jgi:hypothetical protein
VVVWNLAEWRKTHIPSNCFLARSACFLERQRLIACTETRTLLQLFANDTPCRNYFEELCDSSSVRDSNPGALWDAVMNSESTDPMQSAAVQSAFSLLRQMIGAYPKYLSRHNMDCMSSALITWLSYLVETSSSRDREWRAICDPSFDHLHCLTITEEEVFAEFATISVPFRYNFQGKYVSPALDRSPQSYNDGLFFFSDQQAHNSWELMLAASERFPSLLSKLATELSSMVVLHFDVCHKPWDEKSKTLAAQFPIIARLVSFWADVQTLAQQVGRGELSLTSHLATDLQRHTSDVKTEIITLWHAGFPKTLQYACIQAS